MSAYVLISVAFFIALVAVGLAVDHAQSMNRGWTPAWRIFLFRDDRRPLLDANPAVRAARTRYLGLPGPAAMLVVAVVLGWLTFLHESKSTYTTRIGEVRTIDLPNHITAVLNTDTRLTWVETEGAPRVVLLKGEVLFETAPHPARPLSVTAGNGLIRDIGTTFDVYRKGDGTVTVTVTSGAVVVNGLGNPGWERQLHANEQIQYSQSGPITDVHAVSAPAVISWREGILRTSGMPLREFVQELNRYTNKPIILLEQEPCKDSLIGGAFEITNIGLTLRRLEMIDPVSVKEENDRYVLSCRSTTPQR